MQPAVRMELIWQRPCGAYALLLLRLSDDQLALGRYERVDIAARQLIHWRQKPIGGRQLEAGLIRIPEVEHCGQITGHGTAPRGDVGLNHPETLLNELDHGGVVEDLRV